MLCIYTYIIVLMQHNMTLVLLQFGSVVLQMGCALILRKAWMSKTIGAQSAVPTSIAQGRRVRFPHGLSPHKSIWKYQVFFGLFMQKTSRNMQRHELLRSVGHRLCSSLTSQHRTHYFLFAASLTFPLWRSIENCSSVDCSVHLSRQDRDTNKLMRD